MRQDALKTLQSPRDGAKAIWGARQPTFMLMHKGIFAIGVGGSTDVLVAFLSGKATPRDTPQTRFFAKMP
jgi:hypothetical protein